MRILNKLFIFFLQCTLISVLFSTSGYCVCTSPPFNLISRWSASNNALDTMGLNNGELINGVGYTTGMVGQAFDFSNPNAYINAGTSEIFNFNGGAGDFTIDAWVKPTTAKTMGIVAKATEAPFSGWAFLIYADGRLAFSGVGIWEFTSPVGTIPVGTWSHVAVTKSGNFYRLYKDGVEVASYSSGDNLGTSTTQVRIGAIYDNESHYSNFFKGAIDEAEVFSRSLSTAEISSIYNAGNSGQCAPET